jgi:hypothetical protein
LNRLIDDCSLPLVHGSHGLACEVRGGLVIVEGVDGGDLIRAWTNISISFRLIGLLGFRLGPGNSSSFDNYVIRVILPRAYLILLFSFKVLNRRLIEFELVAFVLVIAIGMDI